MEHQQYIQLYTSQNGDIELKVQVEDETIWLTQSDMITLFQRDQSVISRHIKNIFQEGELEKSSNMHFLHIPHSDKPIARYSLDVVISVGYRVKSQEGTRFRIWANKILKQYLLNGYALNQKRLQEKGIKELENTLQVFRQTIEQLPMSGDEALGLLDIITKYTNSRVLLHKYDSDTLPTKGQTTTSLGGAMREKDQGESTGCDYTFDRTKQS